MVFDWHHDQPTQHHTNLLQWPGKRRPRRRRQQSNHQTATAIQLLETRALLSATPGPIVEAGAADLLTALHDAGIRPDESPEWMRVHSYLDSAWNQVSQQTSGIFGEVKSRLSGALGGYSTSKSWELPAELSTLKEHLTTKPHLATHCPPAEAEDYTGAEDDSRPHYQFCLDDLQKELGEVSDVISSARSKVAQQTSGILGEVKSRLNGALSDYSSTQGWELPSPLSTLTEHLSSKLHLATHCPPMDSEEHTSEEDDSRPHYQFCLDDLLKELGEVSDVVSSARSEAAQQTSGIFSEVKTRLSGALGGYYSTQEWELPSELSTLKEHLVAKLHLATHCPLVDSEEYTSWEDDLRPHHQSCLDDLLKELGEVGDVVSSAWREATSRYPFPEHQNGGDDRKPDTDSQPVYRDDDADESALTQEDPDLFFSSSESAEYLAEHAYSGDDELQPVGGDTDSSQAYQLIPGITDGAAAAPGATPMTFIVDSTVDAVDDDVSDGVAQTSAGEVTLRAAIMQANELGGAHNIVLASGETYTLTLSGFDANAVAGDLDILADLTITVAGGGTATIDAGGDSGVGDRVFEVFGSLDISDVTVTGGRAGFGGGIANQGTLTITDSQLSGNVASDSGGGMVNIGVANITDTTVSGNEAVSRGGGIFSNLGGTLTVEGGSLSGNSAQDGGGIYGSVAGTVDVSGATFSSNTASDDGGAVINLGAGTISTSTILNNTANDRAGGIYNLGGTMTMTAVTVSGNSATAGGGVFNYDGDLTVAGGSWSGNAAVVGGGGIYNDGGGTVDISGATFTSNMAVGSEFGDGGAIYNEDGQLDIATSMFDSNSANDDGGAIANFSAASMTSSTSQNNLANDRAGAIYNFEGTMTINGGTVSGNSANAGGGLFNFDGDLTVTGGSWSGNTAVSGGGGIYNVAGGTVDIDGATFTSNQTTGTTGNDGGALLNVEGQLGVANSMFDSNSATDDGGAIANISTATISSSTFLNNTANDSGGGIYNIDATMTITGGTVSGNSAFAGGGLSNFDGDLTVSGGSWSGNTAVFGGGGIYNGSAGTVDISGGTFTGNMATGSGFGDGGAVYNLDGQLDIDNSSFDSNSAERDGGAIINRGTAAIASTTFQSNTANNRAGAIYNFEAMMTITGGSLTGNSSNAGGGLYNFDSESTVTGGIWSGNSANLGGGVYNNGAGALSISDVTFTGNMTLAGTNHDGGALLNVGSNLVIANSTFSDNSATDDGGVIANSGTAWINSSTFQNNTAADDGGAIYNVNGNLTVSGGTQSGNSATSGGAVYNTGSGVANIHRVTFSTNETTSAGGDGGAIFNFGLNLVVAGSTFNSNATNGDGGAITTFTTALITSSTFQSNSATSVGGAIYNVDGTLTVNGGTLSGNMAAVGGAIYNDGSGVVSASGASFSNNQTTSSTGDGGAILNDGSNLDIANSTFDSNTAGDDGGAIAGFSATSISSSTFTDNTAADRAGAVYSIGGTMTITGSIISGNTARSGGGIYNFTTLTVTDTTIADNTAENSGNGYGGGLYNIAADPAVLNRTTFSGNTADNGGGGIFNVGTTSQMTVSNSTFSGNSAVTGGGLRIDQGTATISSSTLRSNHASHSNPNIGSGGILVTSGGTLNIDNTIVSANSATAASDQDLDNDGTVTSLGHNLFGNISGVTTVATDLTDPNPLLGPLQDNGGPTFTHAILAGSPARSNGERGALTTDQRGVDATDPDDDIGAFEVYSGSPIAPQAVEAEFYLPADVPFSGTLSAVDPDTPLASLTFSSLINPAHGSLAIGSNGAFTYDPDDGFEGADRFRLRVSDGTSHSDVWITFHVVTGLDFGDAAAPYATLLTEDGPRHVAVGPFMGALRDTEIDGRKSSRAEADDNGNQADEDGLADPFTDLILRTGETPEVEVTVTNSDTVDATLHGWIDYNGDGTFDPSEYASTTVLAGASAAVVTLTFPVVPVGFTPGTFARFRLSTDPAAANPTGAAWDGEVEDYLTFVPDYGDAPTLAQSGLAASYPVLTADHGAFHAIIDGFSLGENVDAEEDGQPDLAAGLDDSTLPPDDEDGVRFLGSLTQGDTTAEIEVSVVNTAGQADPFLDAWIDFNRDGDWDDSGEHVISQAVSAGTTQLTVDVPIDATLGDTYARFRLHSGTSAITPAGAGGAGEVEDYRVSVTAAGRFREHEANDTIDTANVLPDIPVLDILTATADDWLSIAGTITQVDDVDYYMFSLATAAGVFFDIDSQDTGLSNVLDTVLDVFSANGTSLEANDDGYDFQSFAAPVISTETGAGSISPDSSLYLDLQAGTYYVSVSSFENATAGEYELRVLADSTYSPSVDVYNSNPGAAHTLYLDFEGYTGSNDRWGTSYTVEKFDFDGDTSLYSPAERLAMRNIAQVVTEDFSQFNLNVTTVDPVTYVDGQSFRSVITSSSSAVLGITDSPLGVAYRNSYWENDAYDQLNFVFANQFSREYMMVQAAGSSSDPGGSGRIVAVAIEQGNTTSHEFGHALGLNHFRTPLNTEDPGGSVIVDGIESTPDAGLDREVWSTGTDIDGVSQDDLVIMAPLGFRSGDQGETPATAQLLTAVNDRYTATGVIGNRNGSDVDVFRFEAEGTTIIRVDVDDYSSNLDAQLRILDLSGNVVASGAVSNPDQSFDAGLMLNLPALPPSTWYYAEVSHDGDYSDLGEYTLTIERTTTTSHADPVLNLSLPGPLAYTEGAELILAPAASITDSDSTDFDGGNVYVSFDTDHRTGDRIGINHQGTGPGQIGLLGNAITFGGATIGLFAWEEHSALPLQISLNSAATAAAVTALLQNLTYQSGDDPLASTSINVVVTDGDGGISNVETVTLNVTTHNDAPVLFDSLGFLDYQAGSGAQRLFTNIWFIDDTLQSDDLTDVDNRTFASVTIQITSGHVQADDLLSFDAAYMTRNGLAASYDSVTGILTISGTALVEVYAWALRDIAYHNTNPTPGTGTREITLSINDGTTSHVVSTQTVYLNPDRFEFNDRLDLVTPSVAKAPRVRTEGAAADLGVVDLKTEAGLSLHRAGDEDWFRLTTAGVGTLNVAIEFLHSQGNLSLRILDDDFNELQISDTGDDNESLSRAVTAGETFYIHVASFGGATNTYDLIINGPAVPVVVQQSAMVDEGTTLTLDASHLTATDSDSDDSLLIYTVKSVPGKGTLKIDATALAVDDTFTQQDITDGRISYTHSGVDTTDDSFTFTVQDPDGNESGIEVLTLDIKAVDSDTPVIGNQAATLDEGASLTLDGTHLSATDTDTDDTTLIFTVKSLPGEGTLRKDAATLAVDDIFTQQDITDGRISYTHNDSDTTGDTFDFTVQDPASNETGTATFSFTITPIDDTTPSVGNQAATLDEGASLTLDGSHLSATDADTDDTTLIFTVKSLPGEGTLRKDAAALAVDDIFTQQDITDGRISYTHNDSDTTGDTFDFTVQDPASNETGTATFSFTITPVDDNTPSIGNQAATLDEGGSLTLDGTHLSATDSDTDDSTLIFTVKSLPGEGTLRKDAATLAVNDIFTQQDITDGKISYTHNDSDTTGDTFGFTVKDAGANETGTATFTFTITPIDDTTPSVGNQAATLDEGAPLTLDGTHLSATDSDTDDSTLIFTVKSLPGEGTLRKDAATLAVDDIFTQQDITDGKISYTHNDSDTTGDTFDFTVQDPAGNETGTATFSFTITPVDDNTPSIGNQAATLEEGEVLTFTSTHLSATDTDTDDTTLIFTLKSLAGQGTLKRDAATLAVDDTFTQQDITDGRISYSHNGSNTTGDTFDFTVQDPAGNETGTATFNITVTPLDDNAPVIGSQAATLDEGASLTLDGTHLSATDSDTDDTTLIFTMKAVPGEGTLKKDAATLGVDDTFTQQDITDGKISYTHNDSDTVSDTFDFTVQDPGGNETSTATFTFTITPIFDTPPVVTSPSAADSVNDVAYDIEGAAAADALIQVYSDANNNGLVDGLDALVAFEQLAGGATVFSISTPLTQDAINNFVVTASKNGEESPPTDVPTITETDSPGNVAPVINGPSPELPVIVEDVTDPAGVTIANLLASGAITDGNVPTSLSFQEGDLSNGGIGYVADAVTIRQWSGTNTTNGNIKQNGSPQIIVGINTPWSATSEKLRGLFEFPLDDLQTLINGQGFTVESTELVLTQPEDGGRSGDAGHGPITLEAHAYGFDFDESESTWIDPTGTGTDAVDGGTVSTLLSSASFDVLDAVSSPEVTFGNTQQFSQAINDALVSDGMLRLLLKASNSIESMVTPAGSSQHFARFYAESHTDGDPLTTSDVVVRPELRITLAAPQAIAVTDTNNDNGTWQYSLNAGSSWNPFGSPTETAARLLGPADLVRFVPNNDYTGDADFTFRAWDQTAGDSGDVADTSGNGGTTPFSTSEDTASITVAHGAETSVEIDGSGNLLIRDIDGGDSDDTLSISVSGDGQKIIVHDPNHGLVAGNGAVATDVHTVEVAISGITGPDGIVVDVLDGDDTVDVLSLPAGFDGGIVITGQLGTDTVNISGDMNLAANRSVAVTADIINVSSQIQTSGTGQVSLTADRNIALSSGADLSTVNGGITLISNSSQTVTGDFMGISLDDASVTTTGTGSIMLTGTSGDTQENHGVILTNGSVISSTATIVGAGTITLTGHGRDGAASDGIRVLDAGTEIRSQWGAIQLTGDTAADEGIVIANDSAVKSLGTGSSAATITIHGTSGPGRPGDDSNGLTIGNSAVVTSIDGDIQIEGVGTTGLRGFRFFNGSSITSTGTTASAANISITGTGGTDSAAAFSGVDVTAVTGDITVVGTAGPNGIYGVDLYNGARIEVTDGKLTVTGTGGDGGDGTQRAGVNLSDASASSFGILGSAGAGEIMVTSQAGAIQSRGSSIIGGASATGDITLVASEFKLNETNVQTTGFVTLQALNETASVTLDSADIDAAVTVDGATINSAPGTMITAPSVTFDGALAPGSSPGLLSVDGDAALGDNESFEVEIDGPDPGDGAGKHDQLSATGNVVIGTNVDLVITALNSYTPTAGQQFTIISRSGGSGTFNGLAEGAVVSTDFLGSGLTATISYVGGSSNQDVVISVAQATASIAGRHIFYNNSYHDDLTLPRDGDPAINANDDAAIATDKTALMPETAASFANYTSYVRGINGIMIDITGAPGTLTLADFQFRAGTTATPGSWNAAATPNNFLVRPGAGENGSDRVTITWADGDIRNQWLQVTVLANENTGLDTPDVHYWGNQVGETGNSPTTSVDGSDVGIVVNNPSGFTVASVENPYDINRSGFVDGADIGIVVNSPTGFSSLLLFTPPPPGSAPASLDEPDTHLQDSGQNPDALDVQEAATPVDSVSEPYQSDATTADAYDDRSDVMAPDDRRLSPDDGGFLLPDGDAEGPDSDRSAHYEEIRDTDDGAGHAEYQVDHETPLEPEWDEEYDDADFTAYEKYVVTTEYVAEQNEELIALAGIGIDRLVHQAHSTVHRKATAIQNDLDQLRRHLQEAVPGKHGSERRWTKENERHNHEDWRQSTWLFSDKEKSRMSLKLGHLLRRGHNDHEERGEELS